MKGLNNELMSAGRGKLCGIQVLAVVLAAWSLNGSPCRLHGADNTTASLSQVLADYQAGVSQLLASKHSAGEIKVFHEQWLGRLLAAMEGVPAGRVKRTALIKALGISNSLGNYEQSLVLARLLEAEESDRFQWRWRLERVTAFTKLYRLTNNAEYRDAAIELLWAETTPDAQQQALKDSYRMFKVLSALSHLGTLLEEDPASRQEAMGAFRAGRLLLSQSGDAPRAGAEDLEFFASRQFANAVAAGDKENAEEAMDVLASLPSPRMPVSAHFRDTVFRWYLRGPRNRYRSFVEQWLPMIPDDAERPLLVYELALSYSFGPSKEEKGRAIALFEDLYTNHSQKLLAYDLDHRSANRGAYAQVLFSLMQLYNSAGRLDDAESMAQHVLELGGIGVKRELASMIIEKARRKRAQATKQPAD